MPDNLFDLSGRVAIVTGASRGLGQYLGRALARAGADLVITSRTLESLAPFPVRDRRVGPARRAACPRHARLSKVSSAWLPPRSRLTARSTSSSIMPVNVRKPALDITWDDWNLVLETNLRGSFFVAQAVARHMVARRYGRIVQIGSVTSVNGYAVWLPTAPAAAASGKW